MTVVAQRSNGEAIRDKILDRFVEAVVTGEPCKTSDGGPRRVPAISLRGLGYLTRYNAWPDAMRRVIDVTAHNCAHHRFLEVWGRVGFVLRKYVDDDDLFFAALRVLMPRYDGPSIKLYRGQLQGERPGPSWTRSHHIAFKFALFGEANVDPVTLMTRKTPVDGRPGAVILRAMAHQEIISAPCLLGYAEGEYVVDPRSLTYSTEAVS